MKQTKQKQKIEYGDFQTPVELTDRICHKLLELDVNPDLIIEPTCGIGNFIHSSIKTFISVEKIIGIDINQKYLQIIRNNPAIQSSILELQEANFFKYNYSSLIKKHQNNILVIGNFPWVTNSQQGIIQTNNLPLKSNFQNHQGLDAITGKSNFDISEWMLIKTVDWLHNYYSHLAMLCKTSVARKLLDYIHKHKLNLSYCAIYKINTKQYFEANVDACLLFCKFNGDSRQYFCDVFSKLNSNTHYRIGYYNKTLVRDLITFSQVSSLYTKDSDVTWRSGIKHDCSKVMELTKDKNCLKNGFGKIVKIENHFLFPLLKGSDIANGKTNQTRKYVLVTQKKVGDTTDFINKTAPKTWNYLQQYSSYLDARKSKIYRDKPRYSIFGIGEYSFKPWKIAICGLYKKLNFQIIGKIDNKPVMVDDTVYFLSFDCEAEALHTYEILTSKQAIDFYSSLIFWDEKRPIKTRILNSLNLKGVLHTFGDPRNGRSLFKK